MAKYSEFINFPIFLYGSKEVDKEVPADEEEEAAEDDEADADKDKDAGDDDVEDAGSGHSMTAPSAFHPHVYCNDHVKDTQSVMWKRLRTSLPQQTCAQLVTM